MSLASEDGMFHQNLEGAVAVSYPRDSILQRLKLPSLEKRVEEEIPGQMAAMADQNQKEKWSLDWLWILIFLE